MEHILLSCCGDSKPSTLVEVQGFVTYLMCIMGIAAAV